MKLNCLIITILFLALFQIKINAQNDNPSNQFLGLQQIANSVYDTSCHCYKVSLDKKQTLNSGILDSLAHKIGYYLSTTPGGATSVNQLVDQYFMAAISNRDSLIKIQLDSALARYSLLLTEESKKPNSTADTTGNFFRTLQIQRIDTLNARITLLQSDISKMQITESSMNQYITYHNPYHDFVADTLGWNTTGLLPDSSSVLDYGHFYQYGVFSINNTSSTTDTIGIYSWNSDLNAYGPVSAFGLTEMTQVLTCIIPANTKQVYYFSLPRPGQMQWLLQNYRAADLTRKAYLSRSGRND